MQRKCTTQGKTVLITGANSGVGFTTARQLAQLGATVIMVSRDPERGSMARKEVARVATGPSPVLLIADLSSQAAIVALADEVRRQFAQIDVLINNAGAIFAKRELTVDGIEKTFAVNHLAPFLLTNLLMDLVLAAPAGRIITVSAELHSGFLDFDNLQGERAYHFLGAYNRSKLGNVLFTYELARRLMGTKAAANAVSPGPTMTRFADNMRGMPGLFPLLMKRIPFMMVSAEKGAKTIVYAASSAQIAGVTGRFYLRSRAWRTKPITYNTEVAARLWKISEELTDLKASKAVAGTSVLKPLSV